MDAQELNDFKKFQELCTTTDQFFEALKALDDMLAKSLVYKEEVREVITKTLMPAIDNFRADYCSAHARLREAFWKGE